MAMTKVELDEIVREANDLAKDGGTNEICKLLAMSIRLQAEQLTQLSQIRRKSLPAVVEEVEQMRDSIDDMQNNIVGRLAITRYHLVDDEQEQEQDDTGKTEELPIDGGTEL